MTRNWFKKFLNNSCWPILTFYRLAYYIDHSFVSEKNKLYNRWFSRYRPWGRSRPRPTTIANWYRCQWWITNNRTRTRPCTITTRPAISSTTWTTKTCTRRRCSTSIGSDRARRIRKIVRWNWKKCRRDWTASPIWTIISGSSAKSSIYRLVVFRRKQILKYKIPRDPGFGEKCVLVNKKPHLSKKIIILPKKSHFLLKNDCLDKNCTIWQKMTYLDKNKQ